MVDLFVALIQVFKLHFPKFFIEPSILSFNICIFFFCESLFSAPLVMGIDIMVLFVEGRVIVFLHLSRIEAFWLGRIEWSE